MFCQKQLKKNQETLAHFVAANGNIGLINLLRSHNPTGLDEHDITGKTPLHVAIENERVEMVNVLIYYCDPNKMDKVFSFLFLSCFSLVGL